MKKAIYILLRAYVQLGLKFYFRSYKSYGTGNIPDKGAIMFTANHQNAFLDALVIVGNNRRLTHFLARAEVFKKPFFKWLMSLINMMPIYRIRDGWNMLNNNEEIFKACFRILSNKKALLIFPEGNHGFERRLRPLSKGFTRIAFGTLAEQPELDLNIIPVGINYHKHQGFRTKVSIHYGKPIDVRPFFTNVDDHNASIELRNAVSEKMQKLTINIDESDYLEKYQSLVFRKADFSNLKETQRLVENLDYELNSQAKPLKNKRSFSEYLFRINFIAPLLIWKWISSKVKDPVMLASIKFSVGIFLFPLFLIFQTSMLYFISGNMVLTLIYFAISLFMPFLIRN